MIPPGVLYGFVHPGKIPNISTGCKMYFGIACLDFSHIGKRMDLTGANTRALRSLMK